MNYLKVFLKSARGAVSFGFELAQQMESIAEYAQPRFQSFLRHMRENVETGG